MSYCLTSRSIDHVVLERSEVANSWKTERWDSLRLLTPNWQSRLPGFGYQGSSPDGFRNMPETIAFIEAYAKAISAPVKTNTQVTSVDRSDQGYVVSTNQGAYHCRGVVLATGACNIPSIPECAAGLPSTVRQLTAKDYRNPDQIESGGVMVVGASATGTQFSYELHRSGRPVTLAIGEHIRAPRVYRGKDIKWWMDSAGVMDDHYEEIDDITRARNVPSLQLAGSDNRRTLDLNRLTEMGVKLMGRLAGVVDGKGQFSGSLRNQCEMSDLKMNRLLDRIDEWATERGLDGQVEPPHRFEATRLEANPPLGLNFNTGEIKTVIWATGFRPDYSWLNVDVFDHKGRIRHDGGVVNSPGLYLMGIPFLRRRKSSLIDGAGDDARDLSEHLEGYLANQT
jgi:putative flavoprotein involved in K+ transport